MKATSLQGSDFDATIKGTSQPVLVDFWAEWCGPCLQLAPVIDQIAAEQQGKAVIAKVSVDDAPDIAARYGIRSIPTLIVFKDGEPVERLQGVQSKSAIESAIAAS